MNSLRKPDLFFLKDLNIFHICFLFHKKKRSNNPQKQEMKLIEPFAYKNQMFRIIRAQFLLNKWIKMKFSIFVLFVMLGLHIVASEEQSAASNVKLIDKKPDDDDDDDGDDKYFCTADCNDFPKNTFCGYNNLKVMKTFINQCQMYVENCQSKLGELLYNFSIYYT